LKDLQPLPSPMTGSPYGFGPGSTHASNLSGKFVAPDGTGDWKVLTPDWVRLPSA
jgi:branched-chain amino acid transport system substrate-binding protein